MRSHPRARAWRCSSNSPGCDVRTWTSSSPPNGSEDPRVRRALSHSMPRRALVSVDLRTRDSFRVRWWRSKLPKPIDKDPLAARDAIVSTLEPERSPASPVAEPRAPRRSPTTGAPRVDGRGRTRGTIRRSRLVRRRSRGRPVVQRSIFSSTSSPSSHPTQSSPRPSSSTCWTRRSCPLPR